MRMGEFLTGRPFSRDRLYRKLRQFASEHLKDGRRTEVTFEEKGFRAERDRTRGRWSYEITDKDRFARFAHRLTGYDALTNEDIEQLLAVARFAERRPTVGTSIKSRHFPTAMQDPIIPTPSTGRQ